MRRACAQAALRCTFSGARWAHCTTLTTRLPFRLPPTPSRPSSGGDTEYADRDAIEMFWDRPVVDLIARIFGDEYGISMHAQPTPCTDGGWLKSIPRQAAALINAGSTTSSLFVAIFGGENRQRHQLYPNEFPISKLPGPTKALFIDSDDAMGSEAFYIPELFRQLDFHESIERRLRGRARGYSGSGAGGQRSAVTQWQQGAGAGIVEDDPIELSIAELFMFSFVRFAVESQKVGQNRRVSSQRFSGRGRSSMGLGMTVDGLLGGMRSPPGRGTRGARGRASPPPDEFFCTSASPRAARVATNAVKFTGGDMSIRILWDYLHFFRRDDGGSVDLYGVQSAQNENHELSLFLLTVIEFWLKQTPRRGAPNPSDRFREPERTLLGALTVTTLFVQASSFMYRYILRESCSQFDSPPLTSLTMLTVTTLFVQAMRVHCESVFADFMLGDMRLQRRDGSPRSGHLMFPMYYFLEHCMHTSTWSKTMESNFFVMAVDLWLTVLTPWCAESRCASPDKSASKKSAAQSGAAQQSPYAFCAPPIKDQSSMEEQTLAYRQYIRENEMVRRHLDPLSPVTVTSPRRPLPTHPLPFPTPVSHRPSRLPSTFAHREDLHEHTRPIR